MSILEMASQFLVKFCIILYCYDNNSSVDFKLILFLLWIKGSHQSPNFETFKCFGENLPYSLPQVSFSSHFASPFSVMKDNSSVLQRSSGKSKKLKFDGYFCLKTAFLQLRHIQKIYLTLLSTTCVKIHQIPYVIFETISHFSRYNSSVLL